MADTKRNALAELAECLSNDAEYLYGNNDKASEDVSKAQRIVAELAKVDRLYRFVATKDNYQRYRTELAVLISKCRAIAEGKEVRDDE